ncbi:MAG: ABC transporter permease [Defluviitaleaceae bacterium]|nr:ABC transporter permease [Defluviitaleaceae bacterium]
MSPFWKDIYREIIATKNRFISLLMISLLGAFVVVGIHATAIHMRDAADAAYRRANLYDLQLRHPLGFTQDDVIAISEVYGVEQAMPANIIDVYVYVRGVRRVMRTYSYTGPNLSSSTSGIIDPVNAPILLEGRWPASRGEIAVERRFLREGGLAIGDEVVLSHGDMARFFTIFADDTFTITGIADSPLYLTGERGNTTLGDGSIRYFAFVYTGAFVSPVYTDIYVIMNGSRDIHQVSDAYNAAALKWRTQMQDFLSGGIGGFVFTRQNGIAFESYFQDTLRLESVGYVFPLVFFLVAILVSLTTMTRMIEEQRGQIGIYKALGYRPGAILLKYISYALISGLAGGLVGAALGSQVIPRIIFDAYGHLYSMPESNHAIPWRVAVVAVLSSVASVTVAVIFTCITTVQGEAANLMRPKAPEPGKRVLIEKIPAIWKRLGFISKVTSRNIFRYKRRFFMTLAGVAGCTALLVTAFGLGDSIGSVARLQFEDIVTYDARVHTRELSYAGQAELLVLAMQPGHAADALFIRAMAADAHTDAGGFPATVIVPEDMTRLADFINLVVPSFGFMSQSRFSSPNLMVNYRTFTQPGVIVTEKLAREMGIRAGDNFTITMGDGWSYTIYAAAIVENYLLHYIYMPPELYSYLFGRALRPNGLFIAGDINTTALREHALVLGISNTTWMRENLTQQTDALGIVTIVLMVMACILALVVLFNLTEINILERKCELATIKVLGFMDIQTAMYLYRENMVVTAMGIAVGLVAGVFLNGFILTTVEIDMLKFPHIIFPMSFVLAGGISLLFALVVNVLTYRKLVAIDMVMSLKSVE